MGFRFLDGTRLELHECRGDNFAEALSRKDIIAIKESTH